MQGQVGEDLLAGIAEITVVIVIHPCVQVTPGGGCFNEEESRVSSGEVMRDSDTVFIIGKVIVIPHTVGAGHAIYVIVNGISEPQVRGHHVIRSVGSEKGAISVRSIPEISSKAVHDIVVTVSKIAHIHNFYPDEPAAGIGRKHIDGGRVRSGSYGSGSLGHTSFKRTDHDKIPDPPFLIAIGRIIALIVCITCKDTGGRIEVPGFLFTRPRIHEIYFHQPFSCRNIVHGVKRNFMCAGDFVVVV